MINTLTSNSWKLTNLIASPQTIVGGGLQFDSNSYQSFLLTPVVNVGLATTIYLSSSNTSLVKVNNLNITTSLDLNQSASVTGVFSAFSTSLITGITFIGTGPSNSTISTTSCFVYPFLITSIAPTSAATIYAGTSVNPYTFSINAKPLVGFPQTATFATSDSNLTFNNFTAVNNGIQTFTQSTLDLSFRYAGDNFPLNVSSYSTTVTINLQSSSSYSTSLTVTFNGLSSGYTMQYSNLYLDSGKIKFKGSVLQDLTYPVPISYSNIAYDYPASINTVVAPNFILSQGISSVQDFSVTGSISTNSKKVVKTTLLGYNSTGSVVGIITNNFYTNSMIPGYAKGAGYNLYGELGNNIPTIGLGTYYKTSLGSLPESLVKVSSGLYHNLGLSTSGKVYALGQNTYNQLNATISGLATNIWKLCDPVVGYGNSDYRDIFANQYSSFFITKDNKVYGIGLNNYNQLGFSSNNNSYCGIASFVLSDFYDMDMNSLYRGCFITADKKANFNLYEFGVQPSIDGSSSNGLYTNPTLKTINQLSCNGVTSTVTMNYITKVSVGVNHIVASANWTYNALLSPLYGLSSSGIIAWGYNNYMQIGSSPISSSYISVPNILTKFSSSGQIVPIEYSENIYANNCSTLVIGAGNSNYYIGVGSNILGSCGYISPSITTSIATPYVMQDGVYSQNITDPVVKLTKTPSHLFALTGIGSVYASGTNSTIYKQIISTPITKRDMIFVRDAVSSFSTTQNVAYYSAPSIVNLSYGNGIGTYFNSTNSKLIKARSYVNYYKDDNIDIVAAQFSDKVQAFLYKNTSSSISTINYNFSAYYPNNFNLVDVGVGNSYVAFGTTFTTIPIVIAGFTTNYPNYTNYILSFPITLDSNSNITNIGIQSFISTNEAYITSIACGMNKVKQEKVTYQNTVYDWASSNYNVCAGFSDGLISIISDVNGGYGTYVTFTDPTLRVAYQGYGSSLSAIDSMQVLPYKQERNSPYTPTYCLLASQKDASVNIYGFSTASLGQFDFYYSANQVSNQPASNYGVIKSFAVSEAFNNSYDYYIVGLTDKGYGMLIYSYVTTPNTFFYTNQFNFDGCPTSSYYFLDPNVGNNYYFYRIYATTNQRTLLGWYWPLKDYEAGLNYYLEANHKLVTVNGTISDVGLRNAVDISANLYQSVFLTTDS